MSVKIIIFAIFILNFRFVSAETNLSKPIRFEIDKFQNSERKFSDLEYSKNLIQIINQNITSSEEMFWKNAHPSQADLIRVDFINALTETTDPLAQDFESGFIRIEASAVFKNKTSENILELINNPQFRLEAFSTLTESKFVNNLICEKTIAPTIGKSNYCYILKKEKIDKDFYKYVSMNISNADIANYNAPVYYRTISETAQQVGPDTIYHVITYVRGPKLSKFQKFFATGAIENTQRKTFQFLK